MATIGPSKRRGDCYRIAIIGSQEDVSEFRGKNVLTSLHVLRYALDLTLGGPLNSISFPRVCGVLVATTFCLIGVSATSDAQVRGYLYASVVDRDDQPVLDLTVDDFIVSVGGTEIPLMSSALDSKPPKIALLLDNSNVMSEAGADPMLREGVTEFLGILSPQHEVGLFTIARNVQTRVDFTMDRQTLRSEAGQVFSDRGSGLRMMDALFDIWDERYTVEDTWPVFVLVLTDGSELSDYISDDQYNRFVNDLIQRGANVHVVLFSGQGALNPLNQLGGTQKQYGLSLTENTGGLYRTINTPTGLPIALTELANYLNQQFEEVATRYRILIEVPEELSRRGISVEVKREDVNLQIFPNRSLPQ